MPSAAVVFPYVFDISGSDDVEFKLQGERVTYNDASVNVELAGNCLASEWSAAFKFEEGTDPSHVNVSLNGTDDTSGFGLAFKNALIRCVGTDSGITTTHASAGDKTGNLAALITGWVKQRADKLLSYAAAEIEGSAASVSSSYSNGALDAKFRADATETALQSVYEQILAADPTRAGMHTEPSGNIVFLAGDSLDFIVKVKYGKIEISVSNILLRVPSALGAQTIGPFTVEAVNGLSSADDVDPEGREYRIRITMADTVPPLTAN